MEKMWEEYEKGDNMAKRGRKKVNHVGEKYGWITIIEELAPKSGSRRFVTECRSCKERENIWYSDLNTGNYGKCGCEFEFMRAVRR